MARLFWGEGVTGLRVGAAKERLRRLSAWRGESYHATRWKWRARAIEGGGAIGRRIHGGGGRRRGLEGRGGGADCNERFGAQNGGVRLRNANVGCCGGAEEGLNFAMVSDAEIVRHLTAMLKNADLNTTTTTAIRLQLQSDLGVDLSEKKAFIREQVDLYLQKQSQEGVDGEGEGEGEEEGEYERGEETGRGEQDGEDFDDGDGGEGDENDSRRTSRSSKTRGEPDSKRTQAKIDRAIKASKEPKEKKKRGGGGGGLTKACALSPELQVIIGESELPRTQVVKQLWVYIREHSLQDPGDKRKIICDDALRNLLGTNSTDMFKMNKLLSKHIWPLDNGNTGAAKSRDRDTDTEDAEPKPKKQKTVKSGDGKGKNVGFLAPCPISEHLSRFLDVEDGKISRADAVKRMWDYIKENNLQDPSNKKMILCDEQLQDLFDCEHFIGFNITKLLTRHFLKSERQ